MKAKNIFILFGLLLPFLQSCIGTDIVQEIEVPAQILITTPTTNLKTGEEVTFTGKFTNKYGMEEPKAITWSTSTPDKISVTAQGRVKALAVGNAILTATAENTTAMRNLIIASTNNNTTITRSGIFKSVASGSYTISGSVKVETNNGVSKITVSDDFKTSAGPSLFLLLANHTNGSYAVMSGNNVINGVSAQITTTRLTKFEGTMTWNVPAGVDVNAYKYVLFYCTLGPVFGFAELK